MSGLEMCSLLSSFIMKCYLKDREENRIFISYAVSRSHDIASAEFKAISARFFVFMIFDSISDRVFLS